MVTTRQRRFTRVGVACILLSCARWALLLLVPLLPLTAARQGMVAVSILVIAELFFWAGIALLGKELALRLRRQLNPKRWWNSLRRRRPD